MSSDATPTASPPAAPPQMPAVTVSAPTMRVIDRIRAAFTSALVPVEVPEWGLTLYFGALTTSDFDALDDVQGEKPTHRNLRLLISKARLADGTPAFLPGDLHYLKTEARAHTVTRVINAMYAVGAINAPEAEDAMGNSAGSKATAESPTGAA